MKNKQWAGEGCVRLEGDRPGGWHTGWYAGAVPPALHPHRAQPRPTRTGQAEAGALTQGATHCALSCTDPGRWPARPLAVSARASPAREAGGCRRWGSGLAGSPGLPGHGRVVQHECSFYAEQRGQAPGHHVVEQDGTGEEGAGWYRGRKEQDGTGGGRSRGAAMPEVQR